MVTKNQKDFGLELNKVALLMSVYLYDTIQSGTDEQTCSDAETTLYNGSVCTIILV